MGTSTRPGDLLADRYRLIDLLSESGGGRFWRAHDLVLERYVALHVIAEDDPRADDLLTAARDSARVHDPRVLRVLDAATMGRLCYVVNEWGTGTSLDILVDHGGSLGPRRSAWLCAEVAGALATAHDAGVAHGRLNPENVLIDRFGAVKLIGLGVDAALHGLPRGRAASDRSDLAGVLYCALTGTWPGPSPSAVEPAPREHERVMAPRRVKAGIPRPLDDLWRSVVEQPRRWHTNHGGPDVSSAAAIRDRMLEFIGDTSQMPKSLAATILPVNEIGPVDLPSVPDPVVRDPYEPDQPEKRSEGAKRAPASERPMDASRPTGQQTDHKLSVRGSEATEGASRPGANGPERSEDRIAPGRRASPDETDQPEEHAVSEDIPDGVSITDLPTEAGTPIFDDDDVEWFQARRTPPPPPPPFEPPPERPLFAPDPVRRPRDDVPRPKPATFGPQPMPPGPPPPDSPWEADLVDTAENPSVPGRTWLRLAMVLAAAVVLLVAVVVAFNLGRGRTPLGAERPEETTATTPSTTPPPTALTDLTATDFDPEGANGEERPEEAAYVVDGDEATMWTTDSYRQQFGPGGLKNGVGLVIDLGARHQVTEIRVAVGATPTSLSAYLSDGPPTTSPTGEPAAAGTATEGRLTLEPSRDAAGRYLLLWLTEIPGTPGDYRGTIAEVAVRGR